MEKIHKTLAESAKARWGVLLIVSFAMSVNYYFYDALSPLKDILTTKLGWDSTDYGFFISAYSIPNVFLLMAVVGGIVLDRIGIRITGIMFFASMVLGSLLTYYGATDYFNSGGLGFELLGSFWPSYSPSLKMMSLGFFLFGLGAETTCVVISKIVVKWFKGRELALALGLNVSFGRLGMAAAMIVSPRLLNQEWTTPIFLCFVLLSIGLIAFLFYTLLDRKLDKQIQKVADAESSPEEDEVFRISDVGKILVNKSFLFIALLCVTFYSAVFPFMKYAPDLMINKFGMVRATAGMVASVLPFGTILFTPVFGMICDYKGKSASLMILGSALLISVHLMFALTTITPYFPMFVLGIAFSLVPAAMWPSVAKIVKESRLGTAYGLMFSIQNIGLWLFPMLIGYVLESSNPGVAEALIHSPQLTTESGISLAATLPGPAGIAVLLTSFSAKPFYDYTNALLMLSILGGLGLLFAFLLKHVDKKSGHGLELPNKVKSTA